MELRKSGRSSPQRLVDRIATHGPAQIQCLLALETCSESRSG